MTQTSFKSDCKPVPFRLFTLACLLMALFVHSLCAAEPAPGPIDFKKDIEPIFAGHCFKCHGPEKQKSGLRLDLKESAFKGGDSGEPAVAPGDPAHSHLLGLVTS